VPLLPRRTREIEFDGVHLKISALTLGEVERYAQTNPDGVPEIRMRMAELIALSLNGALNGEAAGDPYTAEQLKTGLDPKLFWELLPDAIMKFTGLRLNEGRPGEAPATSGN
jgi:hypothetical protein